MSQEQLAAEVGISRVQVSRVENGKRKYDQYFLEQAARALDCAPADLLATDPFDSDGLFALYEKLSSQQRHQLVAIGLTFLGPTQGPSDYLPRAPKTEQVEPDISPRVEPERARGARRRK